MLEVHATKTEITETYEKPSEEHKEEPTMEQEIIALLGKSKTDPLTQKINELKEETENLRNNFP